MVLGDKEKFPDKYFTEGYLAYNLSIYLSINDGFWVVAGNGVDYFGNDGFYLGFPRGSCDFEGESLYGHLKDLNVGRKGLTK